MRTRGHENARRDRLCGMRVVIGFRAVSVSQVLCAWGVFIAAICWSREDLMMLMKVRVRLSKIPMQKMRAMARFEQENPGTAGECVAGQKTS